MEENTTNYKHRFTVFTATYNRSKHLPNLFRDLCSQTFKDFEWVVVNDGSTDDTDRVMEEIIALNKLDITYISMPKNGGKHIAWREGLKNFHGRYVITADDDDPVTPNMLAVHNKHWQAIERQQITPPIWEVRTRCITPDGKLIGTPLPEPYFDSTYIDVNLKMGINVEMVGSRRADILRAEAGVPPFLFEDKCSNFPEALRWIRAARKYKTRFVNDATRVFTPNTAGLTNTGTSKRGAYNALVGAIYMLMENRDLVKLSHKRYFLTLAIVGYKSAMTGEKINSLNLKRIDKFLISIANLIFKSYLRIKHSPRNK